MCGIGNRDAQLVERVQGGGRGERDPVGPVQAAARAQQHLALHGLRDRLGTGGADAVGERAVGAREQDTHPREAAPPPQSAVSSCSSASREGREASSRVTSAAPAAARSATT